jgi:drug/metabolite transporter (DMT)-like permease
MKLQLDSKKALTITLTALFLLFAVWLVSPFFHIDASDEANGKINSYRLFLGLMLMIGFVGKSLWDVLAPQGLAKKVSNTKAIAVVALAIAVTGFIVFTVAQALAFYLNTAIATDAANYLP